jgi:hypothetical protein
MRRTSHGHEKRERILFWRVPWHALNADASLAALAPSPSGLSSEEASKHLECDGPNVLSERLGEAREEAVEVSLDRSCAVGGADLAHAAILHFRQTQFIDDSLPFWRGRLRPLQ